MVIGGAVTVRALAGGEDTPSADLHLSALEVLERLREGGFDCHEEHLDLGSAFDKAAGTEGFNCMVSDNEGLLVSVYPDPESDRTAVAQQQVSMRCIDTSAQRLGASPSHPAVMVVHEGAVVSVLSEDLVCTAEKVLNAMPGYIVTSEDPLLPGTSPTPVPGLDPLRPDATCAPADVGYATAPNTRTPTAHSPEPSPVPSAAKTVVDPAPTADSEGGECVGDCWGGLTSTTNRLQGAICNQTGDRGEALSDDITDIISNNLGADMVRVCTAGGSADLSSQGIAFIWLDPEAAFGQDSPGVQARNKVFNACELGGVNVVGHPEAGPAWAIVGMHGETDVVEDLVAMGGFVTCAPGVGPDHYYARHKLASHTPLWPTEAAGTRRSNVELLIEV